MRDLHDAIRRIGRSVITSYSIHYTKLYEGARPGGMTPRQLAAACRAAGAHPSVRSADFVEVDPERDHGGVTVLNMANAFLAFASGLAGRRSP